MKNLRRFCIALLLCAAFALPALAGDVSSPPCTDPGIMNGPPGENNGPPCVAPGEMNTPPGPSSATASASGEPDVGQTGAASVILFVLGL